MYQSKINVLIKKKAQNVVFKFCSVCFCAVLLKKAVVKYGFGSFTAEINAGILLFACLKRRFSLTYLPCDGSEDT